MLSCHGQYSFNVRIDPVSRHPEALQAHVDEIKAFLEVSEIPPRYLTISQCKIQGISCQSSEACRNTN